MDINESEPEELIFGNDNKTADIDDNDNISECSERCCHKNNLILQIETQQGDVRKDKRGIEMIECSTNM